MPLEFHFNDLVSIPSTIVDWLDHVRDVLNIVENYIPDGPYNPAAAPPPTHLPRVAPEVSDSRVLKGLADRHLVGLGHSLGGFSL